MDDFSRYERLKLSASDAESTLRVALCDGLDLMAAIRMVRSVFGLSLEEVKDLVVKIQVNSFDDGSSDDVVTAITMAIREADEEADAEARKS